jgi:GT2 family glycosyltransferase
VQVSFIIPLFNQLSLTQACLASLRATLPANLTYEIILVDDGSTDATRDFLRELAPPHIVLLNERNLGYAASNNRAARVAQGEFLVLLNNDLVLESGWLEPMLAAFARVPRAGVVGNLQLSVETGEVDHAGVIFRDGGYPVHHRERVAAARSRGAFAEFPAVTAACCCVRRDWFLRTGAFDEGYRNGFEDTDLCLRAREDGLVNLVATESVVRHHISQSPTRSAYEFRNAERFLARWEPRTSALEQEWALAEARRHAAVQAEKFFVPKLHRFGFGPATLHQTHRQALAIRQRAAHATTRPVRIGVDLRRMSPGGANGGIKPFLYSLLAEIGRQRGARLNWAIFAAPELRAELAPLLRAGDYIVEPAAEQFSVFRRETSGEGWRPSGTLPVNRKRPGAPSSTRFMRRSVFRRWQRMICPRSVSSSTYCIAICRRPCRSRKLISATTGSPGWRAGRRGSNATRVT